MPQSVCYRAPWEAESVEFRVAELLHGKGRKIAYLYERPDSSTFRYRVYNMVEALRSAPKTGMIASWFAVSEARALARLLPHIDTLVIVRVRYNRELAALVARARTLGVQVLADCDDLVFDVRYAHLIAVNNDYDTMAEVALDSWFAYIGRLQASVSLCEGAIATNNLLAQKLSDIVNGPVRVIPNFLNRRQEELSRSILDVKKARNFEGDGRVTIGYFSGTPTHNLDFEVALPALTELMRKDERVNLRIVGFMKSFNTLSEFSERVERIDIQDWLNLQVKIAEVEVNIAPLQQNCFTNCKSNLKFFEAAAVGTWTCASRTYSFDTASDGPELLKLTENSGWETALEEAVALARDKAAYAERALAAAHYTLDRYSWDRNIDAIVEALTPR